MSLPPKIFGLEAFYFRVCPSVSESLRPENIVNISQKANEGISHNFGHRCIWVVKIIPEMTCNVLSGLLSLYATYYYLFGLIDVLIIFWAQKVKGQGPSRRRRNRQSTAASRVPSSLLAIYSTVANLL